MCEVRTITADNGSEFVEHEKISGALGVEFYFAHPYSSWEHGLNENFNGLLRQYIPKRTNMRTISDEFVFWVERLVELETEEMPWLQAT